MTVDKYVYGMLLHRQIDKYSKMGVRIPASSASDWIMRGWNHLRPLWELLRLIVVSQKYLQFERYSDDIVVHCISEKQALFIKIKSSISTRLSECKLEINAQKTKIVYCRNNENREKSGRAGSFDFLGYTFKPRYCPTKYGLRLLTAACMSKAAKTAVRDEIRAFSIRKFRGNIQEMSKAVNSMIRGWMKYYCKFHKWTTTGLWFWLNRKLIEWKMANKRIGKLKAIRWLETVYKTKADLFAHWTLQPPGNGKSRNPNFGSVRRGGERLSRTVL